LRVTAIRIHHEWQALHSAPAAQGVALEQVGAPPLIGVAGRHDQHVPENGDGGAQALTRRRTPVGAKLIHHLPNTLDVPLVNQGRSRSLPVPWLEDEDIIADDPDPTSESPLGREGIENERGE
jgi:hypothetical protein